MSGTIYCVGLGPGDPDLMSMRAHRVLGRTRHVAYFRKAGSKGRARAIAEGLMHPEAIEIAMTYPVTTEIPVSDPRYAEQLAAFYAEMAGALRALSLDGHDVAVLCEGDPFFYGSFMHLHSRLPDVPVEVIPGITGMSAAWTASGEPITWGDDTLVVLAGTLPTDELAARMRMADALVVMKIGRNLPRVIEALDAAGLTDRALLVEYASMEGQRIRPLHEARGEKAPYFSMVIVHGQGRRP